MNTILAERRSEPARASAACLHTEMDVLGFDRNTTFGRCRACGRVLILQGDRAWYLRP